MVVVVFLNSVGDNYWVVVRNGTAAWQYFSIMRQVCRKKSKKNIGSWEKVQNSRYKMPCLALHSWFNDGWKSWLGFYLFDAIGFLKTRMTESPRKNILLMYLSLLTGLAFFLPEKEMVEIRKCQMDDFIFRSGFNFININMRYDSLGLDDSR